MATVTDVKKLELRITELENELKTLKEVSKGEITVSELKAYGKVSGILHADYGDFCGINDCMPCIIFRCKVGPITLVEGEKYLWTGTTFEVLGK